MDVSDHIEYEEVNNPSEIATYTAVAVANDFKHIHLHSVGRNFDRLHNICEEYYEKASEQTDTLAEYCLENGVSSLCNFSCAAEIVNWEPQDAQRYDFESGMNAMKSVIALYVKSLLQMREAINDESMQSVLDDFIRYWRKELMYKLKRRTVRLGNSI